MSRKTIQLGTKGTRELRNLVSFVNYERNGCVVEDSMVVWGVRCFGCLCRYEFYLGM